MMKMETTTLKYAPHIQIECAKENESGKKELPKKEQQKKKRKDFCTNKMVKLKVFSF